MSINHPNNRINIRTITIIVRVFVLISLINLNTLPTLYAAEIKNLGYSRPTLGTKCKLLIEFSSYCCGHDREAFDKIVKHASKSTQIYDALQWNWGREGEISLCMNIKDHQPTSDVENDLKKMISLPRKEFPPPKFTRDTHIE